MNVNIVPNVLPQDTTPSPKGNTRKAVSVIDGRKVNAKGKPVGRPRKTANLVPTEAPQSSYLPPAGVEASESNPKVDGLPSSPEIPAPATEVGPKVSLEGNVPSLPTPQVVTGQGSKHNNKGNDSPYPEGEKGGPSGYEDNPPPENSSMPKESAAEAAARRALLDKCATAWHSLRRKQSNSKNYIEYIEDVGWCTFNTNLGCWEQISWERATAILGALNRLPSFGADEQWVRSKFFDPERWNVLAKWVAKQSPYPNTIPGKGLMPFRNGVVNLKDLSRLPHGIPRGKPTYISGINMNFQMDPLPPKIFQFFGYLASWDPLRFNLIRWDLRRILLDDTSAQICTCYTGKGGTGKSTFLEFLTTLREGSVASLNYRDLGEKFHVVRVKGSKVLLIDELPLDKLNDAQLSTIKIAISNGKLTGEEKHGIIETFKSQCNVVTANNIIASPDLRRGVKDSGLARRFLLIPVEFELPPGMSYDILGDLIKHTPAIVRWALGVHKDAFPEGRAEELTTHLTHQCEGSSPDPLTEWVLEKVRLHAGSKTWVGKNDETFDTLHGNYLNFLRKTRGPRIRVPHDFSEQLASILTKCGVEPKRAHTKKGTAFENIVVGKGLPKGAKRIALREGNHIQLMRKSPVLTSLGHGGAIEPIRFDDYVTNDDLLAKRYAIQASLGLVPYHLDGKEKFELQDLPSEVLAPPFDPLAPENEGLWEEAISRSFEEGDIAVCATWNEAVFDSLERGVSLPRERFQLALRGRRSWEKGATSSRRFDSYFDMDLLDMQDHFAKVLVPDNPHKNWSVPYPEVEAACHGVGRLKTFPLAAPRIISTLNAIAGPIIQGTYKRLQAEEKEKEQRGEKHDKWYLPSRKHMRDAFALSYTESFCSVYPRMQPIAGRLHGTVLSQNKTSFKLKVFQEMLKELRADYEIWTVDLRSCHSLIYSGLYGDKVPAWNAALASENLWQHLGQVIPAELVKETDFYWLKKQLKIWVYKSLQGGNPLHGQGDHEPLKQLFPHLTTEARIEKGDAMVLGTPPLVELGRLRVDVGALETIYFPTSTIPFRYSFQKGASERKKLAPYTIHDWQGYGEEELPSYVNRATAPQKVSRVLTGHEVMLLMQMVTVIANENLGVVLANESDGLSILTRSGEGEHMVKRLNTTVSAYSEKFVGRSIGVDGIMVGRSESSPLLH